MAFYDSADIACRPASDCREKDACMKDLAGFVRTVADFPKPGVTFRDVMPLLADAESFAHCIDALAEPWLQADVQVVCGIDARGFIFGAALAHKLRAGFVPLRKAGKLPPPVIGVDYRLEYGMDRLEARSESLQRDQRVIIVDDVLATGGTLAAASVLVNRLGGQLAGASVFIELDALAGRSRWSSDTPLHSLLRY
jgi:adenine phosphoribosyltransferase